MAVPFTFPVIFRFPRHIKQVLTTGLSTGTFLTSKFLPNKVIVMKKTTVKDHGFEGILLPATGRKDKIVIVISGSNGGMRLTKQCADFYNKNGIPALAIALFATKETREFLDRVPIEYVYNAIQWLKTQGYEKIGIDGMSKGSEMALVAASLFDDISCVVARVPSYFVSEGLVGHKMNKRPSGTSCWSYKGEGLPFAPYRNRIFDTVKMLLDEKELHFITFNKDKIVTPESLIHLERIAAPILMLSSKNDTIWPSYENSVYMENKLEEIDFPYMHKHVAYENMSHMLMTKVPFIYRLAFKSERTHAKACKDDRESMKKELLNWICNVW